MVKVISLIENGIKATKVAELLNLKDLGICGHLKQFREQDSDETRQLEIRQLYQGS